MTSPNTSASPAPSSSSPPQTSPPSNSSSGNASTGFLGWLGGVFGADATKNVIAACQLIAALGNIALVFYIFSRNTLLRQKERSEDLSEKKQKLHLELSNFWIQKLIMEPNNKWLHDFFNECAALVELSKIELDHPMAVSKANDTLTKFSADLRTLRSRIQEPLILVNEGFNSVAPIINELQDVVSENVQRAYLGVLTGEDTGGEKPTDKYRRIRRAFFEEIFKAQKAIMTL